MLECRQWRLASQRDGSSGEIDRLDILDDLRGEQLGHARPAAVSGSRHVSLCWRWKRSSLWEFREVLDESLVFVMKLHRWTRRVTVADALSQHVGRVGYAAWCRTRGWITQDRHGWQWTIAASFNAWEFVPTPRGTRAGACIPLACVTVQDPRAVIVEAKCSNPAELDPFTQMMWLAAAVGLVLLAAPARTITGVNRTRDTATRLGEVPPLHTRS